MVVPEDVELKWYRTCFLCPCRVRCRNEHVEKGSKKCYNLLRREQQKRSSS